MHQPDVDEMRFELGTPIRQLGHLEILVLILQLAGVNAESIGDKAAEPTQGNSREGEHRESIIERLDAREVKPVAVAVERVLDLRHAGEQDGSQQEEKNLF